MAMAGKTFYDKNTGCFKFKHDMAPFIPFSIQPFQEYAHDIRRAIKAEIEARYPGDFIATLEVDEEAVAASLTRNYAISPPKIDFTSNQIPKIEMKPSTDNYHFALQEETKQPPKIAWAMYAFAITGDAEVLKCWPAYHRGFDSRLSVNNSQLKIEIPIQSRVPVISENRLRTVGLEKDQLVENLQFVLNRLNEEIGDFNLGLAIEIEFYLSEKVRKAFEAFDRRRHPWEPEAEIVLQWLLFRQVLSPIIKTNTYATG